MSSELRQSSRRTSKRPKVFGSEEPVPTATLIPFPSGRKSFFGELTKFHNERGTPLPRFPTISGQFVDLFELYCAVINRGGYNRSTTYDTWASIAETLGFSNCSNLTVALRQVYARYLAHYESVTISLDDEDYHDYDDLHGEAVSNFARRKTLPTITVCNIPVQMTYTSELSAKQPRSGSRSTSLSSSNYYLDKMFLSLVSGLPNEHRFVLDACMLMSHDPNHASAICEHDYMLNVILANIGVLPNSSTFSALFTDWFSKVTPEANFTLFWMNSVSDPLAQKFMMNLEIFQEAIINQPSIHSMIHCKTLSKCDSSGKAHKRASIVLYFIRHLSFDAKNQQKLTQNEAVQQFLLFCIGSKYANLKVLALDTIVNLSPALSLSNDCLFNITMQIVLELLNSVDSVDRIRCMEILTGLCQNAASVNSVIMKLELSVFEKIIAMLTVQDLLVLLSCVGLLYQLSYLGTDMCDVLVKVRYMIDLLTSLVTFDVQSMGLEALTSVKVIEQPKSLLARGQPSTQSATEQQQGMELERLAVKWALTNYEFSNEENNGILSNDVLSHFKKYCAMVHFRIQSELSMSQFNRCLKIAFPATQPKLVSSSDGSMYFAGLRRKQHPSERYKAAGPPNGMNQFPHLRPSNGTKSKPDQSNIVNNGKGVLIKPRAEIQNHQTANVYQSSTEAASSKQVSDSIKFEPHNGNVASSSSAQVQVPKSKEHPVLQNQNMVSANHVVIPRQLCESPSSKAVVTGQNQNQQILVQVVMPGSNTESAFKKQNPGKTIIQANNGPITISSDGRSNAASPKNAAPTFVLSSVANNQVYLSPVTSRQTAVSQSNNLVPGSLVKGHSNVVNANQMMVTAQSGTTAFIVNQAIAANNNNTSAQVAINKAKTVNIPNQQTQVILTSNNLTTNPSAVHNIEKVNGNLNQVGVVPNLVAKSKPVTNNVAPHLISTNQATAKAAESAIQPTIALVNGNYATKINGEAEPMEIVNAHSVQANSTAVHAINGAIGQNRSNNASPTVLSFTPVLKQVSTGGGGILASSNPSTSQIAYQNQNHLATSLNASNSVAANNRCEVNGVVYKLVNDMAAIGNNSSHGEGQQKVVYVTPKAGNENPTARLISQPQIVINGDAGDHLSEVKNIVAATFNTDVSKTQIVGQAINSIPAISSINGDSTLNRKRKNSVDIQYGMQNQVLITSATPGDEPSLGVFRKIKIGETVNNPQVSKAITTAQPQTIATAGSVAKKEPVSSSSFSNIPSLHAAVNSVIAASADGSLLGAAANQLSVSSSDPGVARILVQPVNSPSSNVNGNQGPNAGFQKRGLVSTTLPSSHAQAHPGEIKDSAVNGFHGNRSSDNSNLNPSQNNPLKPGTHNPTSNSNSSSTSPNEASPIPPKEPRLEPGVNIHNSNAPFRCDWYNCSSRFEKWQAVLHHCCRVHCAEVGPEGAICQWSSCDGLRRKKLSLFTHLSEKHCTETLLKNAASRDPNRDLSGPLAASAHAESLYSTHTLHHALQRSGWMPPNKDQTLSVLEKEGPVSKAVRLNAALVLRNLAQHSSEARGLIRLHERKLNLAASSCIEAAPFLANCLLNLCNLDSN